MNLKTKFLLKKTASCVCLIVAMALFFTGWISVRTNSYTKEIKSELRELDDELEELEEECEDIQDELEEMADDLDTELNFSVEDMYKSAEKLYKTIEDLSLSPKEMVGILPIMNKLTNLMEEFEESELPSYMMPVADMDDFVEVMEEIKGVFIFLMIFFIVTIALDILYIVFHILNKKGAGYAIIPFQAIWLLIAVWPVSTVNIALLEEIHVKVLKTTPAPYIALVLVVASCIIWYYAMKDQTILNIQGENADSIVDREALKGKASELKGKMAGIGKKMPDLKSTVSNLGEKVSDMTGKIANQTSAGTVSCPNCGKECAKGVMFCTGCGSKLEQQEATAFCMNCGQRISATATFCNHCGAKVEQD